MEAFHEMDVAEILKARRKQPGVKRRVNRGYYGEPVCPWCRTEIPHVTCDCARCDSMVCDSCGHALPRAYNRVLNCDIGWAPDLTCAECNAELAAESGTRISAAAGTK